MRRPAGFVVAVVAALLVGRGARPVVAAPQDAEADAAPDVEEAATAVVDAVKAGDRSRLAALAKADEPDPWRVADALCARGAGEAARAFAEAAPRPDTERLAAAVTARCSDPADARVRAAVAAAVEALDGSRPADAVEALDAARPAPATIGAVAWGEVRAEALAAAGRAEDAEAAWGRVAEDAVAVGWRRAACDALTTHGDVAYRRGDAAAAVARWSEAMKLAALREDRAARAALHLRRATAAAGPTRDEVVRREAEAALGLSRALEDDEGCAVALLTLGELAAGRGEASAAGLLAEARTRAGAAGVPRLEARALSALGDLHGRRGERAQALAHHEQALALLRAADPPDDAALGASLRVVGRLRTEDGDPRAERLLHEAVEVAERCADRAGAGAARIELGAAELRRGDPVAARTWLQAVLDGAVAGRDDALRARALGYLGAASASVGALDKALKQEGEALALLEPLGDAGGAAAVLGEMADLYRRLAEHGRAEDALRRARAHAQVAKDAGIAVALATHTANLRWSQGRLLEALDGHEEARTRAVAAGLRAAEAVAWSNLGAVHLELGELEDAGAALAKARDLAEDRGDRPGLVAVLVNLAAVRVRAGRPAEALPLLDRAQAAAAGSGDRAALAAVLLTRAEALGRKGAPRDALPLLERAEREADSLRDDDLLVRTLSVAAQVRLDLKQPEMALEVAKRALPIMQRLLRSHGDDDGAIARAQYADLYDAGVRAAVARRDAAPAVTFLESGRAGSLLEALGGRDALEAATVDPALRQAEADARAEEARARKAFADASLGDDRGAQARARDALDAAQQRLRDVVEQVQRDRRSGAAVAVFYPRAATAEELTALLRPGDALVLYGLTAGDAVAVVLEPDAEPRCVTLGTSQEVEAARAQLAAHDETAATDGPAAALADRVVAPLGLGPHVKRVLVSPDGPLATVPPALLFPDRAVAYVPSGTTYRGLLEGGEARGERVLAFGDPDYAVGPAVAGGPAGRGPGAPPTPRLRYAALPGTRREVEAIGDVKRLGADFTVAGVRSALAAAPRWRSVLFACHGLVDREQPWLSCLAVTAGPEDDGHLLARDVALLRIPADLTTLSACQTGLGKIVRGEGLLGLTRAVMVAGSPRVLASLWKVDDEATEAFMRKFYEVWNPRDGGAGLPAAEALRVAQAHVRAARAAWKHPTYWAGWVLWGRPD